MVPPPNDNTIPSAAASNPNRDPSTPLAPGATLKDRYVVERELGRGGIGIVYLARDERLHGMPVVVKFLLDQSPASSWAAKKFLQEAEALTRIAHPGVVKVLDRDRTADGRPFFVMEFIRGRSLRSAIDPQGLPLEQAAALIAQIGQALGAAHREGVFHRDLKPENVMLAALSDGDEHVKLIDFGIAKVRDSQAGTATEVAVVAGSMYYMAPEQFMGEAVTAAADIYAFALIACELITGRRPFNPDAATQIAAMQQLIGMQRSEQVVPLRQLRPSLPAAAETVLLRGLAFDPQKRPQDARQFGDELARALTKPRASSLTPQTPPIATAALDETIVSPRARPIEPSPAVANEAVADRSTKPFPLRLAALGALLLIGAVAAFALLARSRNTNPSAPVPAPAAATSPATAPLRSFTYSVTVRQDPKRRPDSKPFQLPGEIIFSPGDYVRFAFSSAEPGYLYVINESPAPAQGDALFNVLFPTPTSNSGSPLVAAREAVRVPDRGEGFVMDREEGVEKLWLVWSTRAVEALAPLARWANPTDRGEIKDAGDVARLREFLRLHESPAPEVARNDEARTTTVSARADTFVKLVKLEHHN
jgi:serine/threonine-protein kinase